jgi:hypothetical protein
LPLPPRRALPISSFGEDEDGEIYFLMQTITGKGIQWFMTRQPGKP